IEGTLFTEFTWGGYTLYDWPDQKVFIDGGTDFYGGDLMRRFTKLKTLLPGWREELHRWNIDLVVLKPDTPLAAELFEDDSWTTWYCDDPAVVLVRQLGTESAAPSIKKPSARCGAAASES